MPAERPTADDTDPWPVLGAEAYYGLAGEVVTTIAPQTEADPVALLLQFWCTAATWSAADRICQVGKDRHFANLYVPAGGRHGQSAQGSFGQTTSATST